MRSTTMECRIELVSVPVSDVDRAIAFFADPDGNAWTLQQLPART